MVNDAKNNEIYISPPSIKSINALTDIIDGKIHFGLLDVKSVGMKQIEKFKSAIATVETDVLGKPLSDLLYTVGTGDDQAANLKMLKHMKEREIERVGLSEKGLDYAVNKLWGAAPATLGLDEDLFKEVKE